MDAQIVIYQACTIKDLVDWSLVQGARLEVSSRLSGYDCPSVIEYMHI